jgi:hypothetical protein
MKQPAHSSKCYFLEKEPKNSGSLASAQGDVRNVKLKQRKSKNFLFLFLKKEVLFFSPSNGELLRADPPC